MNTPSLKTLATITNYPRELRLVLVCTSAQTLIDWLDKPQPFGCDSAFQGFKTVNHGYMSVSGERFHDMKLAMANELCGTYGVEYQRAGKGSKSPAFKYCNSGDGYSATLLYVNGRYRVGCWADIVERGNYE